jgi:hypothetical protein
MMGLCVFAEQRHLLLWFHIESINKGDDLAISKSLFVFVRLRSTKATITLELLNVILFFVVACHIV